MVTGFCARGNERYSKGKIARRVPGNWGARYLRQDSTLRRWACEYEEMGDDAFPGNGSPKINKDYEIAKLKKKVEEPGRGNGILKNFRAFLSQGHARGSSSSKGIGARSAPSRRHAG